MLPASGYTGVQFDNFKLDKLVASLGRNRATWRRALLLYEWLKDAGHELDDRFCTTLIRMCADHGDAVSALGVYEWMRAPKSAGGASLRPTNYTYTAAMRAALGASMLDRAMQIWGDAQASHLVPDCRLCLTYIEACTRAGDTERALNMYCQMRDAPPGSSMAAPTVHVYTAAMRAASEGGRWHKALDVWADMRRAGCEPTGHAYAAVISACAAGSDWVRAVSLFEEMSACGIRPDVVSCTALVTALAASGEASKAEEVVQWMLANGLKPNVRTYTALMTAMGNAKEWARAVEMLYKMQLPEWGKVAPNAYTYSALLKSLGEHGQWQLAEAVFGHLEAQTKGGNAPPPPPATPSTSAGLKQGAAAARAAAAASSAPLRSSSSTSALTQAHSAASVSSTSTSAYPSYGAVWSSASQLNGISLLDGLSGAAAGAAASAAGNFGFGGFGGSAWITQQQHRDSQSGVIPTAPPPPPPIAKPTPPPATAPPSDGFSLFSSQPVVSSGSSNSGSGSTTPGFGNSSPAMAEQLSLLAAAAAAAATASPAQGSSGNFGGASGRGSKAHPGSDRVLNEVVCGALMFAYERAGKWAETVGVLGRARSLGLRPNTVMYNTAISAAGKAGQLETVEHLFKQVPEPDAVTYETLIAAYGMAGLPQRAEAAFRAMMSSRLIHSPRDYAYCGLIAAYSLSDDVESALSVRRRMRADGVTPTVHVYNALIAACERGALYDRALELHGSMRRDGVEPNAMTAQLMTVVGRRGVQTVEGQQVAAAALSAAFAAAGSFLIQKGLW